MNPSFAREYAKKVAALRRQEIDLQMNLTKVLMGALGAARGGGSPAEVR